VETVIPDLCRLLISPVFSSVAHDVTLPAADPPLPQLGGGVEHECCWWGFAKDDLVAAVLRIGQAGGLSALLWSSPLDTTITWFGWALLSAMFAALTAIFAKIGLDGVDSDLATLIRTGVILVLLTAFVIATGKWRDPSSLPPRTLLFLGLSGIATGASWVCYFRALKAGDASKVAPVDKLSVVLVALFAVMFLHERPSMRDWLGIAMVAAGVLVLALKR